MRRTAGCILFATIALFFAGCTSSGEDLSDSATEEQTTEVAEPEASAPTTAAEPATEAPATSIADDEAEAEPESTSSVAPATAYDDTVTRETTPPDETSAWISRRDMSAEQITMGWSAPEGADDYQIHRVVRISDQEPEVTEMTDDNRIHSGEFNGSFTDEGVEAGTSYWYGVRGLDADGNVRSHGWHPAVAITDEEPPQTITDLTYEFDGEQVLLTWSAPEENYKLHSFRILRGIDGAEPEAVSATWNLDQTSFIDELPEGSVVYQVVSLDFHWNKSEPATVTIER